ncbi:hypothetical protein MNBD_ALPHA01-2001 [hydrothermal vent metagenome]|uniref:DUF2125 domain-containing protein n=1 Tax=hydrothermal vent metagenome TaxID=652676 RepID=A0A3B0SKT7_9ZZZZ
MRGPRGLLTFRENHMRLKILASAIIALVVGYSIFWHYMAGEVEDRIEIWVKGQKSQGLTIKYADLEISGFPYRMELSLSDVNIVKKGQSKTPVLFTSPAITLIAFPWKINHGVIISQGGKIRLGSSRSPRLTMTIGKTRASVIIDFIGRKFQSASFIMENVTWITGRPVRNAVPSVADEVRLHLLQAAPASEVSGDMELPILMKLYLAAKGVVSQQLSQQIPGGIFGKKADQVIIDLQLHGEKFPAFTRDDLSLWRDSGGTMTVKNLSVSSGEMDISLDGEVTLDRDLKPLGAFASRIRGIGPIVDILSRHSAFQVEPGKMILQELKRMARSGEGGQGKGKDSLDLAISMQGGLLFLGPIPVYELVPVVE